jgi:transposase
MVRAIAYARVKTDKIDAAILAKLHAGGFLPEVWIPDDDTQRQRRHTAERMGVLEQVVRTKGRIHSILHANLIPKYSGHLFGKTGKKWLAGLPLPDDEKAIVGRCPSSDDLRHVAGFQKGGSGSSVIEIMRHAVDAASDGLRLSGV